MILADSTASPAQKPSGTSDHCAVVVVRGGAVVDTTVVLVGGGAVVDTTGMAVLEAGSVDDDVPDVAPRGNSAVAQAPTMRKTITTDDRRSTGPTSAAGQEFPDEVADLLGKGRRGRHRRRALRNHRPGIEAGQQEGYLMGAFLEQEHAHGLG